MYWYGVDLHTTGSFIVAQLDENEQIKVFKFGLNAVGVESFKKMLTKEDKIAFEVSTNVFWFYDQIKEFVSECKVINPKKFEIIYRSTSKTDKKDARLIAKFLKYNLLPEVFVPEKEIRELRSLFTSYRLNNKIKVISANRIYSLLRQAGKNVSKREIKTSLKLVLNMWDIAEIVKKQVKIFLEQIEFSEKQQEILKNEIYLLGEKYKETVEILTSESGISVFIALGIIADVAVIARFKHPKKLVSYLGVAPKVDSTNETTRIGSSHKECRKLTKTLMTQGINHFRNSSGWIDNFYREKIKGKNAGKVRIAIVRKKIVGIYHMLQRKQYSKFRKVELHERKMKEYEELLKKLKKAA